MQRLDIGTIPEGVDEVRLFMGVRNELLRLPYLFDYYRAQGVDRFFVADDGSDDGTREWLIEQPATHVFAPDLDWVSAVSGLLWLTALLAEHGLDRWCVIADADEIMVWPHWEQRSLRDLCDHLDRVGHEAVHAVLLDMYADGPIREAHYVAGADPLATCPMFDPQFVERTHPWFDPRAGREFRVATFQGGMRPRVFGVDPWCSKVPLLKFRRRHIVTVGHHDVRGAHRSDLRAAVLHFKFLADFAERVDDEVEREVRHAGSGDFDAYAARLAAEPALRLAGPGSLTFRDSAQLVDLGIMQSSPQWDDWGPATPVT